MRVRSPACTTLMRRRSPSATSCTFLPIALVVFGKSSAMRGGLLTVKPGGRIGGRLPERDAHQDASARLRETLIDSMLFVVCAERGAEQRRASAIAASAHATRDSMELVVGSHFLASCLLLSAGGPVLFLPSCHRCPARFPSASPAIRKFPRCGRNSGPDNCRSCTRNSVLSGAFTSANICFLLLERADHAQALERVRFQRLAAAIQIGREAAAAAFAAARSCAA